MISRSGLIFLGLLVASTFAAEAEDGAGGAAKNEARLLVGKHVRFSGEHFENWISTFSKFYNYY